MDESHHPVVFTCREAETPQSVPVCAARPTLGGVKRPSAFRTPHLLGGDWVRDTSVAADAGVRYACSPRGSDVEGPSPQLLLPMCLRSEPCGSVRVRRHRVVRSILFVGGGLVRTRTCSHHNRLHICYRYCCARRRPACPPQNPRPADAGFDGAGSLSTVGTGLRCVVNAQAGGQNR